MDSNTEYLLIEGGKSLKGQVEISGAKNSALKQIAASILLEKGISVIRNIPALTDINYMLEIIKLLGGETRFEDGIVYIDNSQLSSSFVPFSLASKLRASFVFLGALVGRFKEARVALPGGCNIGSRKVDLHLKGLRALGAKITEDQGYVVAKADRLIGTKIYLDLPSNGATENIMIAACMAEGETIIENAAQDPEIIDLANYLNKMGCEISGAGSSNIHIMGKKISDLHSVDHETIPDRIEAATYMIAGIITKGKVTVKSVIEEDLQSLLSKLEDTGVSINIKDSGRFLDGRALVDITSEIKGGRGKATDITTVWYPGFSTDIQPIFMSWLNVCEGTSVVVENIYESRFQHVDEFKRMGATIEVNGKAAIIKGVKKLTGTTVIGKDLRSTAALVISALAAKGSSEVRGLDHLDRGYEKLESKLLSLGAKIKRMGQEFQFQEDTVTV